MNFTIPVKLVSEANQREHHFAKMRRKQRQQKVAAPYCAQAGIRGMNPSHIRLTRLYCGRGKPMDEHDNLAGSFKHVVDEICRWLEIDDGDIRWTYAQERADDFGVRVEFDL